MRQAEALEQNDRQISANLAWAIIQYQLPHPPVSCLITHNETVGICAEGSCSEPSSWSPASLAVLLTYLTMSVLPLQSQQRRILQLEAEQEAMRVEAERQQEMLAAQKAKTQAAEARSHELQQELENNAGEDWVMRS